MAGEFEFLEWIAARQKNAPWISIGVGDDLAACRWPAGQILLAGVDQVLDGVHFDSGVHSPRQIGRKAMNRNLSDCAAMACLPAAALASVALPRGVGMEYARELYLGLEEAGREFDCAILGGDTGTWEGKLALSVTILGRDDGIAPIGRSGAKAGDGIFVTGALGGSILGRHLTFEPRVHLARKIARAVKISTMIDLSDGLSRDLRHICKQSGVGAEINAQAIPIHADAVIVSRDGRSSLEHALHDGEDYELLLTCAQDVPEATKIGVITADRQMVIRAGNVVRPLVEDAWEHKL